MLRSNRSNSMIFAFFSLLNWSTVRALNHLERAEKSKTLLHKALFFLAFCLSPFSLDSKEDTSYANPTINSKLSSPFDQSSAESSLNEQRLPLPLLHSFHFSQLTNWTTKPNISAAPILAKNGEHAVFSLLKNPLPIYLISLDNGNTSQIDHFPWKHWVRLSLSDDASIVVSSDGAIFRVAHKNQSIGRTILSLKKHHAVAIKVSGNGKYFFFILARDTETENGRFLERGVYVMNLDGSHLRQLVSPLDITRYLGIPEQFDNTIFPFTGYGTTLDVSHDGSKIIFISQNRTFKNIPQSQRLFSVYLDGSKLTELEGDVLAIYSVAISGNGKKVAYTIEPYAGPVEGRIVDFDGSQKRLITSLDDLSFVNHKSRIEPIQLSFDGSKVLFGSKALLFDTQKNNFMPLGTDKDLPLSIFDHSLRLVSMNGAGNQFLFLVNDQNGQTQLATMKLDESLEKKQIDPSITNPTINSRRITLYSSRENILRAHVSSEHKLLGVIYQSYYNGQIDKDLIGSHSLLQHSSTNIFETTIMLKKNHTNGPRTLRIKAEAVNHEGMHQATVLEVGPVEVR